MGYFPPKITKFCESSDSETISNLICNLGKGLMKSLPITVLNDKLQVMTAFALVSDFPPTPIAEISGRIEPFISGKVFRHLDRKSVV